MCTGKYQYIPNFYIKYNLERNVYISESIIMKKLCICYVPNKEIICFLQCLNWSFYGQDNTVKVTLSLSFSPLTLFTVYY